MNEHYNRMLPILYGIRLTRLSSILIKLLQSIFHFSKTQDIVLFAPFPSLISLLGISFHWLDLKPLQSPTSVSCHADIAVAFLSLPNISVNFVDHFAGLQLLCKVKSHSAQALGIFAALSGKSLTLGHLQNCRLIYCIYHKLLIRGSSNA